MRLCSKKVITVTLSVFSEIDQIQRSYAPSVQEHIKDAARVAANMYGTYIQPMADCGYTMEFPTDLFDSLPDWTMVFDYFLRDAEMMHLEFVTTDAHKYRKFFQLAVSQVILGEQD